MQLGFFSLRKCKAWNCGLFWDSNRPQTWWWCWPAARTLSPQWALWSLGAITGALPCSKMPGKLGILMHCQFAIFSIYNGLIKSTSSGIALSLEMCLCFHGYSKKFHLINFIFSLLMVQMSGINFLYIDYYNQPVYECLAIFLIYVQSLLSFSYWKTHHLWIMADLVLPWQTLYPLCLALRPPHPAHDHASLTAGWQHGQGLLRPSP